MENKNYVKFTRAELSRLFVLLENQIEHDNKVLKSFSSQNNLDSDDFDYIKLMSDNINEFTILSQKMVKMLNGGYDFERSKK